MAEFSRIFQTREQALEVYKTQLSRQKLFVEVFEAVSAGTPVSLTMTIRETMQTITLPATVVRMVRKKEAIESGLGPRAGAMLSVPFTQNVIEPLRNFFIAGAPGQPSSAPGTVSVAASAQPRMGYAPSTQSRSGVAPSSSSQFRMGAASRPDNPAQSRPGFSSQKRAESSSASSSQFPGQSRSAASTRPPASADGKSSASARAAGDATPFPKLGSFHQVTRPQMESIPPAGKTNQGMTPCVPQEALSRFLQDHDAVPERPRNVVLFDGLATMNETLALVELEKLEVKTANASIYQLFGLTNAASRSEIRSVYNDIVKNLHPDKYENRFSADTIRRLEEAYQTINDAYEIIQNSIRRDIYNDISIREGKRDGLTFNAYREWMEQYQKQNAANIRKAASFIDMIRESLSMGLQEQARQQTRIALQYDPINVDLRSISLEE